MTSIDDVRSTLLSQIETSELPRDVLKANELKALYSELGKLEPSERAGYGKSINELKLELERLLQRPMSRQST